MDYQQNMPDAEGYFGKFGGSEIPPALKQAMDDITQAYHEICQREDFQQELQRLLTHFVGRPSPVYHCEQLSRQLGGAQIFLKREDLNHTGAHKINHCLGEALLARFMGKKKSLPKPALVSMVWHWPRPVHWWVFPAKFTWAR